MTAFVTTPKAPLPRTPRCWNLSIAHPAGGHETGEEKIEREAQHGTPEGDGFYAAGELRARGPGSACGGAGDRRGSCFPDLLTSAVEHGSAAQLLLLPAVALVSPDELGGEDGARSLGRHASAKGPFQGKIAKATLTRTLGGSCRRLRSVHISGTRGSGTKCLCVRTCGID